MLTALEFSLWPMILIITYTLLKKLANTQYYMESLVCRLTHAFSFLLKGFIMLLSNIITIALMFMVLMYKKTTTKVSKIYYPVSLLIHLFLHSLYSPLLNTLGFIIQGHTLSSFDTVHSLVLFLGISQISETIWYLSFCDLFHLI